MVKNNLNKIPKNNQLLRLLISFVALSVLLIVISTVLFHQTKRNVLSIGHLNSVQVSQDLKYYLIEESNEITVTAKTIEVMMDTGKSNEDILDYLTFESRIVTETINESYTGMYGYFNGEYLDGSGWTPDKDYEPTERPWYKTAIEGNGRVMYVTPYLDAETGNVMMSICKMLPDRKSVVSLDITLTRIQDIIDISRYSDFEEIIVVDKDHLVVAALDGNIIGNDISEEPMLRVYDAISNELDENGYFEFLSDESERCAVFTSNVENQWQVFLVMKTSKLLKSLYYIISILIAATLAFVVFVAITFDYLNKRRIAAESFNNQLESIADIYISVHKINIENNSFEEVRCLPYVREQIRLAQLTHPKCQDVLETVMKSLCRDEYWEDVNEFRDFDTLDIRMGNSNTLTLEFLGIHGWAKARIIVLERKNDRITSILWLIEDIGEEKKKQNELRYLSETDLMTGIKNRGSGEKKIKEIINDNPHGMFCVMDADDFKAINDNYGHNVGDEVIKAIAECLQKAFRTSDIILRLGGDEFAAFVPRLDDIALADKIFERFISAINSVYIPDFSEDNKIEISVGASFVTPNDVKDFESLYKEADKAVYYSKKTPGSCVTYYSEEIESGIQSYKTTRKGD